MYIFTNVSKNQKARLELLAKQRGIGIPTLAGSIIGQYLSGRLRYVSDEKRRNDPLPSYPFDLDASFYEKKD